MNKTFKMTLNILLFILIAGFGYYMVRSILSDEKTILTDIENSENTFTSPYKKTNNFDAASEIICFDIYENRIYVAQNDRVSVFDLAGIHQNDFEIEVDIRDIAVEDAIIYLLYPTRIDLFSFDGQKKDEWEACSDNSDYCAFTRLKIMFL